MESIMVGRIAVACVFVMSSTTASAADRAAPAARAWTMLQEGVVSPSSDSRLHAVGALGLLVKSDRARKLAETGLLDSNSEVRSAAARALGQIGIRKAAAALKLALKDQDTEVVLSAANALLTLGDRAAYAVYYAVLTGERKAGD